MSTQTILELAGEVRERIRKALPSVVRADQVESLTETLFTTLVNGGGPLGDPLGGWVKLVSEAFYLGNWLATHNPNDPPDAPPSLPGVEKVVEAPAPRVDVDGVPHELPNTWLVGVRGDRIVHVKPIPPELDNADALNLAAWIIALGDPDLQIVPKLVQIIQSF